MNLQGCDLAVRKGEAELKGDGAAGEIAGHSALDDDLAVAILNAERLDRVAIFLLGLGFPSLYRGKAGVSTAFIQHGGIDAEARVQAAEIAGVLRREIEFDRFRKCYGHGTASPFEVRLVSPRLREA